MEYPYVMVHLGYDCDPNRIFCFAVVALYSKSYSAFLQAQLHSFTAVAMGQRAACPKSKEAQCLFVLYFMIVWTEMSIENTQGSSTFYKHNTHLLFVSF